MSKLSSCSMPNRLGNSFSCRFTLFVLTLNLFISRTYAFDSPKYYRLRRGADPLEALIHQSGPESRQETLNDLAASLGDRLAVRLSPSLPGSQPPGSSETDSDDVRNKLVISDFTEDDSDRNHRNDVTQSDLTRNDVIRIHAGRQDAANEVTTDQMARLRRLLAFRLQKYSVTDLEGRSGPRFSPWGGKRVDGFLNQLEEDTAFPSGNKRAFHPWGGKKNTEFPIELGFKRKFQPWGGKRGGLGMNKIFTPWGGK